MNKKVNIVWLRRDLRIDDNTALIQASKEKLPIILLFIFDKKILNLLEKNDSRVSFIYDCLLNINEKLKNFESSLLIKHGYVTEVWIELIQEFSINTIYSNEDYELYGIQRDLNIKNLAERNNINFKLSKDHVIFEKNEVLSKENKPYTVFTPYKNQWLKQYFKLNKTSFHPTLKKSHFTFPSLESLGFIRGNNKVKEFTLNKLIDYKDLRDIPSKDMGTYIGPHLRFGTISIREVVEKATTISESFLSELIWREFFIQILFHFPNSVKNNFKKIYDGILWRNNEEEFDKWCKGITGYPLVDAGIRELNTTGYMHNRVRMVAASFLCKHLLIEWQWGEAYFASKLLDFELASNVGNWQWAAGTGCDAAPYFRVFNPTRQQEKFDPEFKYIKKWIPEFGSPEYPKPMVEHSMARERALNTYKRAIKSK